MSRWGSPLLNLAGVIAGWISATFLVLAFESFPYWITEKAHSRPFLAEPYVTVQGLALSVVVVGVWGGLWLLSFRRFQTQEPGRYHLFSAVPAPLLVSVILFAGTALVSTWLIARQFTFF